MRSRGGTPAPLSDWTKRELCDDFRGTTYSKVNYPFAAYDTIDAYYKQENHIVDYNSGDYVTDSIFEEKFLDGSDKYAVFFNSNQSTTKVTGNGEGKLLIIKDSYAVPFAAFASLRCHNVTLIDPRYYEENIEDFINSEKFDYVLVMFSPDDLAEEFFTFGEKR